MKFYVAGRFDSYEKVRAVIDRLKSLGHTVTYDWTRTEEFDRNGVLRTRPLSKEQLAEYARNDMWGVIGATAFVLCADDSLAGAYVEFGFALHRLIPCYVIGSKRWTIFYELPNVRQFETYEEFYKYVEEEL